jgi:uncharacterized protein YukE
MATVSLTPNEFAVDLGLFLDAIGTVQGQADTISGRCSDITAALQAVPPAWNAPAEVPFGGLSQKCIGQMNSLNALLTEMIKRMQDTYQNYLNGEQTNFNNLEVGGENLEVGGERSGHGRAGQAAQPGDAPRVLRVGDAPRVLGVGDAPRVLRVRDQ